MSNPGSPATPATQKCTECRELERGRKEAGAAGDFSRVSDFNVLIVRHRVAHAEGPEPGAGSR